MTLSTERETCSARHAPGRSELSNIDNHDAATVGESCRSLSMNLVVQREVMMAFSGLRGGRGERIVGT